MDDYEKWDSCPEGVVSEMARGLRDRERRQALLRIGTGAALGVLLIGGVSASVVSSLSAGEMTCDRAISLFADYHDGRLRAKTRHQVEAHFEHCPQCRERYRHEYLNEAHRLQPVSNTVAVRFSP